MFNVHAKTRHNYVNQVKKILQNDISFDDLAKLTYYSLGKSEYSSLIAVLKENGVFLSSKVPKIIFEENKIYIKDNVTISFYENRTIKINQRVYSLENYNSIEKLLRDILSNNNERYTNIFDRISNLLIPKAKAFDPLTLIAVGSIIAATASGYIIYQGYQKEKDSLMLKNCEYMPGNQDIVNQLNKTLKTKKLKSSGTVVLGEKIGAWIAKKFSDTQVKCKKIDIEVNSEPCTEEPSLTKKCSRKIIVNSPRGSVEEKKKAFIDTSNSQKKLLLIPNTIQQ